MLTLREAVELALQQNPDVVISRLEEQKAAQSVRQARDPFYPKVFVGSGAAYTNGYPLSVNGNPPQILQANAVETFFNRTKTYQAAEARANQRTALIDVDIKRDDVAYRTASLYLDTARAALIEEKFGPEIQEFERIRQVVSTRVAEGREKEIEADKAALNLARAKQRAAALSL